MYLYNSATHKKEELKTHTPNHVEMYTCGPTVYHFAHIGNLRSYIMEDVLEKYLRFAGYSVNRVMNITDVGHLTSDADEGEDKMLKGAKREHKSVMEIAQFYTDAFFADCQKLHIKRPDVVQPATGLIDDYIKIITKLLDTGYAYQAGGNIYFDTSKLERYYIFNDHNEEDLAVGVREGVEEDTNKRNKNDFVLWFTKSKFEDQALKWDSPWGVGYPGWHIECSGISMKYNGEYLDLHCGGVDNAFPHHTNEIAQSESYLGHPWCPHWCHVAHLNTTDGKMSKSKGEFLTASLLEQKGYDPLAYRFFCLQSHYRKGLLFSWENLDNATVAYNKLLTRIAALKDEFRIGVMEADIDSDVDAATISTSGAKVIQLHTGGMCHLDADMTRQGLRSMGIQNVDIAILENVGNLVCPAEFDTGAVKTAMILSVPEGHDKPLKYPLMFRICDAMIINKTDVLPYFDFDLDKVAEFARQRNPDLEIFPISAKTGEGVEALADWLCTRIRTHKEKKKETNA